ncbi:MAG: pyridoxal phosphate-dependent aminotransferase, partial [Candidatus Omnitrophota bacterium]
SKTLNPLSEKLVAKRRAGANLIDLTQTNPTCCELFVTGPEALEALTARENIAYEPHPKGLLEARLAVVDYYAAKGIAVDSENIFLTSGTSEAYSFVFKLLTDPHTSVLAPKPGYPLFDFLGDLHDIKIQNYPLRFDAGGWGVDEAALSELLTGAPPRALLAVHPNNPTGHYLSARQRHRLRELSAETAVPLVVDEVFFDYALEPVAQIQSFAEDGPALTFTLSGISKILCLPQMKLSWVVVGGPPSLVAEAVGRLEVISDTYLSAATPIQRALPVWMRSRAKVQSAVISRIRDNFDLLRKVFQGHPVIEVLPCQAGWVAVLKICLSKEAAARFDDESLAIELLEKTNVVVHPGYFYDFTDGPHWVLSLLLKPEAFECGIRAVDTFLTNFAL